MKIASGLSFLFFIISVILVVIVIYFIYLKIFGYSPSISEVNLALTMLLLTCFISFGSKFYLHMGKVEQYIKNSEQRFSSLDDNFKYHINDFHKKK